jgi:ubiquinone/menaquinone biosynthesis C-methylase UbiE
VIEARDRFMADRLRRSASGYDGIANQFEKHRAFPQATAEAIRHAVLACVPGIERPRLLDLGAGTGRIGRWFVKAADDYVGLDLSWDMLKVFQGCMGCEYAARLVQADGGALPFPDATFDAVLLAQVFSGTRCWRSIADEACRVRRSPGALIVGGTVAPRDGVDARMRERLEVIVCALGAPWYRPRSGVQACAYISAAADAAERVAAAQWQSSRTARGFLERHRDGVRFSRLPESIRLEALRQLSDWAQRMFGSLDAVSTETFSFELQIFRFQQQVSH